MHVLVGLDLGGHAAVVFLFLRCWWRWVSFGQTFKGWMHLAWSFVIVIALATSNGKLARRPIVEGVHTSSTLCLAARQGSDAVGINASGELTAFFITLSQEQLLVLQADSRLMGTINIAIDITRIVTFARQNAGRLHPHDV
jgi:hypothetical protein